MKSWKYDDLVGAIPVNLPRESNLYLCKFFLSPYLTEIPKVSLSYKRNYDNHIKSFTLFKFTNDCEALLKELVETLEKKHSLFSLFETFKHGPKVIYSELYRMYFQSEENDEEFYIMETPLFKNPTNTVTKIYVVEKDKDWVYFLEIWADINKRHFSSKYYACEILMNFGEGLPKDETESISLNMFTNKAKNSPYGLIMFNGIGAAGQPFYFYGIAERREFANIQKIIKGGRSESIIYLAWRIKENAAFLMRHYKIELYQLKECGPKGQISNCILIVETNKGASIKEEVVFSLEFEGKAKIDITLEYQGAPRYPFSKVLGAFLKKYSAPAPEEDTRDTKGKTTLTRAKNPAHHQ